MLSYISHFPSCCWNLHSSQSFLSRAPNRRARVPIARSCGLAHQLRAGEAVGFVHHQRRAPRASRPARRVPRRRSPGSSAALGIALRRASSRSGPSRTSPAALRSPPTITHSGIDDVAEIGDRDARSPGPASPIRRCAAASPAGRRAPAACGSRPPRAAVAEQRGDRARGGEGLEAAAVAAAAHGPAVGDQGVADLAGGPSDAMLQAPLGDQAGADAGRDLDVGDLGSGPWPRPTPAPQAPRGWRRSRPRPASRAGGAPPRRHRRRPSRAGSRRPGRPRWPGRSAPAAPCPRRSPATALGSGLGEDLIRRTRRRRRGRDRRNGRRPARARSRRGRCGRGRRRRREGGGGRSRCRARGRPSC